MYYQAQAKTMIERYSDRVQNHEKMSSKLKDVTNKYETLKDKADLN